jgi:dihydrofolate synthase/folylpolyglutamate synthase
MDLAAWLSKIEQLHPQEIELGLERVASVWARLNKSLEAYVITVAGTNGKGSTVGALQAAALSNNLSVCAFTSPHILRYNERIRLNGVSVSDSLLCAAFAQIEQARGDISLSYFEFNTLAALVIAVEAGVDLLLLEVGLGGRLDAVNIIDADLAVITSIALDHEDWLGSDLNVIAAEKAGIARDGCPVVVGEVPDLPFWSTFYNRTGETFVFGRDFSMRDGQWLGAGESLAVPNELAIPANSVAIALQVICVCPLFGDRQRAFASVLATRVAGRMQRLVWRDRHVLFDVAHNPASVGLLAASLASSGAMYDAVFVCMADKDIDHMLPALVPYVAHWWLPRLMIPRAATPESIAERLGGEQVSCFATVAEMLAALPASDRPLLVAGSFYTVSEVMAAMGVDTTDFLQET